MGAPRNFFLSEYIDIPIFRNLFLIENFTNCCENNIPGDASALSCPPWGRPCNVIVYEGRNFIDQIGQKKIQMYLHLKK